MVESEVAQSCPTLCDPMDCSLPGFSIHGIFQARVLEWVALSFTRGSSLPRDRTQVSVLCYVTSVVSDFATSRTVARQVPLCMGFSRQEYWSGLPFPSPVGLPDPGIEAVSLMSPALAGSFFTTSATWESRSQTLASLSPRLSTKTR